MLTKKQLFLTIIKDIILIAIFAGTAIAVVTYSTNRISQISSEMVAKQKISFALQKRSETYYNLKNDFSILGDSDKIMNEALIPSDDISRFISDLENLGLKNGVNQSYKFGNIVPGIEQGELTISSIDYSVRIKTSLHNLISYLKNFESMPYFSGITDINMSSSEKGGLNGNSDVLLNAKLYARQNI